jgi:hypothetical protein
VQQFDLNGGDKAGYSYPIFWSVCKLLTRGRKRRKRAG